MIYVQIIFLIITGFFTIYLFILTISAFNYKPLIYNEEKVKNRFAVIIPAHNEEAVISETIKHILKIDYPKDLFNLFVIADNCTDKTPIIASKLGALVLDRTNGLLKGKGYALKWALELLIKSKKKYDAFLIVDADTIVSENILNVLNHYVNAGGKTIQCSDLVMPQPNSWSSEITRIGLMLYNFIRPLGKKLLGLSAGLRGNGMCFTADIIKKYPWRAYSQTEDLEYGINLLMNGISVTFAPEAVVYAIMPSNPKNAETQRARWEIGRFPIVKKYSWILLSTSIKQKSIKIFDSFIDLISPAFVNLFSFTFLMILLNALLIVLNIEFTIAYLTAWIVLLSIQVFYVISGFKIANADKNAYKALFNVPRYALWKFLLYVKLFIKGHSKFWIRTYRESDPETIIR